MRLVARHPVLRTIQAIGFAAALVGGMPFVVEQSVSALHRSPYVPLDLKALTSPFDEKNGTLDEIPKSLRDLNGRRVSVEGFMIPMDQSDSISQFAVVPEIANLEFGVGMPPGILQTVVVTYPKGKSTSYIPDRIRVDGVLTVGIEKDQGFIVDVLKMTPDSVQRAPTAPPYPTSLECAMITGLLLLGFSYIADIEIARRRRAIGHCRICGYDLRASPERCPECGTAHSISQSAAK
jgi:hypothetical protein